MGMNAKSLKKRGFVYLISAVAVVFGGCYSPKGKQSETVKHVEVDMVTIHVTAKKKSAFLPNAVEVPLDIVLRNKHQVPVKIAEVDLMHMLHDTRFYERNRTAWRFPLRNHDIMVHWDDKKFIEIPQLSEVTKRIPVVVGSKLLEIVNEDYTTNKLDYHNLNFLLYRICGKTTGTNGIVYISGEGKVVLK